jgi:uncharacterized membrane protein YbhN (UPF0104 family)
MSSSAEPSTPSSTRRWLVFAAKLVVSAALLALLVSKSDAPRLWGYVRGASIAWMVAALGLYLLTVLASAWRWGILLDAQGIHVPGRRLTQSFLVATFFNNFLPSNIGGDVVRITDTAKDANSKTLAALVVIMDRGIGLLGLVLLAAVAAAVSAPAVFAPGVLERVLGPLRRLHPEWIGARLEALGGVLARFRESPASLLWCFAGALVVQALLVGFYAAVAHSIGVSVSPWHMAIVVPMSFLVQMLPISVNGLGLREATFSFYFSRLGLPIEAALVVSLLSAGLVMVFSLSGAAVYVSRGT